MNTGARFDLHVHSGRSADAKGTPLEIAVAAKARGLAGFALTDHDAVWSPDELAEAQEETGLLLIPGCEVTSLEGHILAFGVTKPLPKGEPVEATVEAIHAQGGVAVPAHPLRSWTGIGPSRLAHHAVAGRFACIEAHNARERGLVQENTRRLIAGLGLPSTGGTDAHWIDDVGTAWTVFDHAPATVEDAVQALRDGLVRPGGGRLPRAQVWRHGLSVPFRRNATQ